MKILFVLRHPMYLRNYESTIRLLLERGHRVHVGHTREADRTGLDEHRMPRLLAADFEHFTFAVAPSRKDLWSPWIEPVRMCLDYLFYLEPKRKAQTKLRGRVEKHVVPALAKAARWSNRLGVRGVFSRLLKWCEKLTPVDAKIQQYLRASKTDVLVVTPLVDVKSRQIDYLKAARAAGVPCVHAVASWDNLTSKGVVQIPPHRMLLWNEFQRREAVEMHRVDPSTIVVTGAQLFDQWFEQRPQTTKEEYCRKTGLAPGRAMVTYLCSSGFIARDEAAFVTRWLQALRQSGDATLREACVLVRPHPANIGNWPDVDLSQFGNVVVWPRAGALPIDADTRRDYFDTLYHSSAVVGINTSALFEAGVVGRRCFTILEPQFASTQGSLPHFEHLLRDGFLIASTNLQEHCAALSRELSRPTGQDPNVREYLREFLRPHGLDQPCTPLVADAIEAAAGLPVQPEKLAVVARPARWAVQAFLHAFTSPSNNQKPSSSKGKATKKGKRRPFRFQDAQANFQALTTSAAKTLQAFVKDFNLARRQFGEDRATRRIQDGIPLLLRERKEMLVVGPWMSEVGFELLYWVPFLRRQLKRYKVDRENVLVISRGNTFGWYEDFAAHYADIFDFHTPQEFYEANRRREMQQYNGKKHLSVCEFEDDLIARVLDGVGRTHHRRLHPSTMYNLYMHYWKGTTSEKLVTSNSDFSQFSTKPARPGELPFTGDYVAVKLYFSSCLPRTPENVRFAQFLINKLAETQPVVLLNTGLKVDDHGELAEGLDGSNVIDATAWMPPRDNLAIQTAVVANAKRLFCTYGGFSYLGPMHGVDTVALYSDANFKVCHLALATRVLNTSRDQSFALMSSWALEGLLRDNAANGMRTIKVA